MNTFGHRLRFSTFGESHGKAIGCIIDGVPAGIKIDATAIQSQLDRRKPGLNKLSTQRSEADAVEILSGIFEGVTTGTSLAMIIYNTDHKSKDYGNIKDLFRPSHADYTYYQKYGIRDYRGGGRSSARETAARVAAGAVAKLILDEFSIKVASGIYSIGDIEAKEFDFEYAKTSPLYSLDKNIEAKQVKLVEQARDTHNSIGGVVLTTASNLPAGLGEPIYYKLDAILADAMMSINGSKAVEIGDGIQMSCGYGTDLNDQMNQEGFISNHSGGILGGISSGTQVIIKTHFKPTPSIYKPQHTVDTYGNEKICEIKGRHDPCIAIRGSIVCEAMAAFVIADMLLLNTTSKIENIKKVYSS
jgi:chorismate synthase